LTLFQKRITIHDYECSWVLLPHSAYLRDVRWYAKKRPAELTAILRNLERYMTLLARSPSGRSVQAGFLHPEPHGMIALDQRGGGGRLQETRLYCYAHTGSRTVHLLGIGDKSSQPADLARLSSIARTLNS
jgi:hypothetical protein